MYQFNGFTANDFQVFLIPEFHERMSALRTLVRPKLAQLGDDLAPQLESLLHHPMYPHTASHARRRVNPPDDTWVAFSRSERGYKRYAHFEVGIFKDGVFVRFSIKPESTEDKAAFLHYLRDAGVKAFQLSDPDPIYYYENDHGLGAHNIDRIDSEAIQEIAKRTQIKSHGFTLGITLDRDDSTVASAAFIARAYRAIEHLSPLYEGTLSGTIAHH